MNFLYQIVTSTYVYTLYEEDNRIFLHILDLRTEESKDVFGITKILGILHEDTEIPFDDIIEIEDVITTVLISE